MLLFNAYGGLFLGFDLDSDLDLISKWAQPGTSPMFSLATPGYSSRQYPPTVGVSRPMEYVCPNRYLSA